jgi:hypothetical protein
MVRTGGAMLGVKTLYWHAADSGVRSMGCELRIWGVGAQGLASSHGDGPLHDSMGTRWICFGGMTSISGAWMRRIALHLTEAHISRT